MRFPYRQNFDQFLALWVESIYDLLGVALIDAEAASLDSECTEPGRVKQ